jgi:hypothetical protein
MLHKRSVLALVSLALVKMADLPEPTGASPSPDQAEEPQRSALQSVVAEITLPTNGIGGAP